MKKNILFLSFFLLANVLAADAQSFQSERGGLNLYIHAGYNFGGFAPVPLPNNIRKIESYSPGFSPNFGVEVEYGLGSGWGVGSGIGLDWKSMKVTDSVQYMHTMITMDGSSLEGDFTGTNSTKVKNSYLAVPIYGSYLTSNGWRLKAGVYLAMLLDGTFDGSVSDGYLRKGNSLGEKVEVDFAEFDFSDELNKFDFGVQAGAEKYFSENLAIAGNLKWGLMPGFPDSFSGIAFKMYNIYFDLGVTYRLTRN